MKYTFLIEIGTEELPQKSLRSSAEFLSIKLEKELKKVGFLYDKITWFASSRRLSLRLDNLFYERKNFFLKKIGPSISEIFDNFGNITSVAESWMEKHRIKLEDIQNHICKKNKCLFVQKKENTSIQTLLRNSVKNSLVHLSNHSSKVMCWGDKKYNFLRPIRTLTLLLNEKIISGNIFGIKIDRILYGHRFIGEKIISLKHANQYQDVLFTKGKVIVDFYKRKKIILDCIEKEAEKIGGIIKIEDKLLEELTSLVEWPKIASGNFDKKFLLLPDEILICIMQDTQKYFPVFNSKGNVLSKFIFVLNIDPKDSIQEIIHEHENTLHQRLLDAKIFLDLDKKTRLIDRLSDLDSVIFHKKLGSMKEKSFRMCSISAWIARQIGANIEYTKRASLLCKCDLLTHTVFEFPNVQGVVGMYCSFNDGENKLVAIAQKEQYLPRFYEDSIPSTMESCAISISDKIDTIVGMFSILHFPKGSRDPFGLRRAAIGIIRIILEKQLYLDLDILIQKSISVYKNRVLNEKVLYKKILDFILDRLFFWMKNKFDVDSVNSILFKKPIQLVDFYFKVQAIDDFKKTDDAKRLIFTYKRIKNILNSFNQKISENFDFFFSENPLEIEFARKFIDLQKKVQSKIEEKRYYQALLELSKFCCNIDVFFSNIVIITQNIVETSYRLSLLSRFQSLVLQISDVSHLNLFKRKIL